MAHDLSDERFHQICRTVATALIKRQHESECDKDAFLYEKTGYLKRKAGGILKAEEIFEYLKAVCGTVEDPSKTMALTGIENFNTLAKIILKQRARLEGQDLFRPDVVYRAVINRAKDYEIDQNELLEAFRRLLVELIDEIYGGFPNKSKK